MVRQQIVLTSRFPPIRAQVFNKNDTYVFIRIGAYLHYMEPKGEKPSALYQHPGATSPFGKNDLSSFGLELIFATYLYRTRRGETKHSL